jgi:hypothetical protein
MPDWGLQLSRDGFQKAERFIRFQLEREIALKAWGSAGEFRRILPVDRALQKAVELLAAASTTEDRFRMASLPGVSDWTAPVLEESAEPLGSDELLEAAGAQEKEEGRVP